MIELGEFEPARSFGPTQELGANGAPTGAIKLGRFTTSQEQKTEAIRWMIRQIEARRDRSGRAKIIWSRGEPTYLELRCVVEHVNGEAHLFTDQVTEYALNGAEIPSSRESRTSRLIAEVAAMADQKTL